MTNGERIKEIFPNINTSIVGSGDVIDVYNLGMYCQTFDVKWWNAEYIKPTIENDLEANSISRQEVLRLLANSIGKTNTYLQTEVLKMSPVASQEPKTGHWIKQNDDYYDWYECSECGYGSDYTKYCPHCGAKMESED